MWKINLSKWYRKKEVRHDIIPRQMIAALGEEPYCMLECRIIYYCQYYPFATFSC